MSGGGNILGIREGTRLAVPMTLDEFQSVNSLLGEARDRLLVLN